MPEVVCPTCCKKLRPPDRLAGRRVTCPRCEAILTVPLSTDSDEQIPTDLPAVDLEPEDPPLPKSARFGIIALFLGCISILIMCLPIVGYASLILSSVGVLVALWGLLRAHYEGNEMIYRSTPGGAGIVGSFGKRARDYPLAGVVVCLLALVLAIVPILSAPGGAAPGGAKPAPGGPPPGSAAPGGAAPGGPPPGGPKGVPNSTPPGGPPPGGVKPAPGGAAPGGVKPAPGGGSSK
ncbi:MAG TPA: hypothetical protein VH643_18635 [Gemmataceae bacterium]